MPWIAGRRDVLPRITGRRDALPWGIALVFAVAMLYATSRDVFWNGDFYLEAYPAYDALMVGDVGRFFDRLPGYSGFTVVVGAPAALLTGAFGGVETMVFRVTALPGLAALAAVGVALAGPLRAAGSRGWLLFLVLGAGGGLTYQALVYGHPEDLLATGAAVGAILTARSGRVSWASLLIVVAVVAKQWAVLAILPAAMAAPQKGARIGIAGIVGSVVLVGLQTQLGGPVHGAITQTGTTLFHPHQLFWPLGLPATPVLLDEVVQGARTGPAWLSPLTRPLIVGSGVAVALLWWLRSGHRRNRDDVFGVLALVMLLRCMLDPWDIVYYHLPVVVALAAWEARRGREMPVLALAVTAACWLTFITFDAHTGYGPYLAYLAWAVPLAVGLAIALLRSPCVPRLTSAPIIRPDAGLGAPVPASAFAAPAAPAADPVVA